MEFEWDQAKADQNFANHDVTFAEGSTVFGDPFAVTYFDPDHSEDEDRYLTIGFSEQGRLLIVSHTDRNERTRLISARDATKREQKVYESERNA